MLEIQVIQPKRKRVIGVFARRLLLLWLIASTPALTGEMQLWQVIGSLPVDGCSATPPSGDTMQVSTEVNQAIHWNTMIDGTPSHAIAHQYFSTQEVIRRVDLLLPQLTCIAESFGIPPALLAGIFCAELNLDYTIADALIDSVLQTPAGPIVSGLSLGVGMGQVHLSKLRLALNALGESSSSTPFYRSYRLFILMHSDAEITRLATNFPVLDLANAAVLARYYAELRLDAHPMERMTALDMAVIFSAYRGGVSGGCLNGSCVDKTGYRWGLVNYRRASDPLMLGDIALSLPYFSYYVNTFADLLPSQARNDEEGSSTAPALGASCNACLVPHMTLP